MSKKNIILSTLLLFVIIFPCFLSIFTINNSVEIDDKQNNTNVNNLSTPKSSGYAVTELWNSTTKEEALSVAVSGDGNYMAVAAKVNGPISDQIYFFNTSDHDGIPMWRYKIGDDIDSIAISDDGYYIAAASSDGDFVFLFNKTKPEAGQDKKYVWKVDLTGDGLISVDISADGKYIVATNTSSMGSPSSVVYVYNNSYAKTLKQEEYLWKCSLDDFCERVAISGDGNFIVAGGTKDIDVSFWNNTDYNIGDEHARMWTYDTDLWILSVAISYDGGYIAAGCQASGDANPEFFVFNNSADGGLPEWSSNCGNFADIKSVAMSKYGEFIVTGADITGDGSVRFYNNSKRDKEWSSTLAGEVNAVDITEDGKYVVAGTNHDPADKIFNNTVFLFNNTEDFPESSEVPEWSFNTSDHVYSVSISSKGNYIGACGKYLYNDGMLDWEGCGFLFYHAIPSPSGPPTLLGGGDDDDDDDDDTGVVVVIVVIIIIASAGGVVVVIIVLIKKGIISKPNR